MSDRQLYLPTLDLLLDGSRLPDAVACGFSSLRVHQQLSLPSVCELGFAGLDGTRALDLFRPGAQLGIAVRGTGPALFEGRISAVEVASGSDRTDSVAVRAYDPLLALRNRQAARSHAGATAADLAREMAADLGLAVECEAPGPAWSRILQTGTDFDLLAGVAARSGLYLAVQDGSLVLMTLQGRGEARTLALHDELHEVRFEINAHGSSSRVAAWGWDPARGAAREAQADLPRGPALAGRQPLPDALAAGLGGHDGRGLWGHALQDEQQAQALAQADLDRRSAQALVLRGTAAGDARLRPGARIRVSGVAPRLAGEHVLTGVRHTLDPQHGFQSEITSAPPELPPHPAGTLMTLGVVTRIDDPQHLGRVQAALPAYGGIASDWMQVLGIGAGKGKGLVAHPDVGDRVLLLLDAADPAQAVVLGSLWCEDGLPEDQGSLGKDASFCFVTPGGHRLRLDDGKRTVTVGGSAGSALEMSPDGVRLHAAAPMTIEAPGQRLVIRASRIDFERT